MCKRDSDVILIHCQRISVDFVANLFVFQLLLTVNPETLPWPSLEFLSQSLQGILGKSDEIPHIFPVEMSVSQYLVTTAAHQGKELDFISLRLTIFDI